MEFVKFPKIGRFGDTLKSMRKNGIDELTFNITPKMHGTNACIAFKDGQVVHCQSRNRILTILKDNAGFAHFVQQHKQAFEKSFPGEGEYYVYGEWIGPSTISGAAVGALNKKYFVAFKMLKDGKWHEPLLIKDVHEQIRYVAEFWPKILYTVKIEKRNEVYDELYKIMETIERECPVAKGLEGVEGGIGEGLVGSCVEDDRFWFKIKGDAHAKGGGSKKKLSDTDYEAINGADDFMSQFFNEARLNQGLEYLKEMALDPEEIKNTGSFIKWGITEFEEEGLSDYMEMSLEPKYAKRSASKMLGSWFTQRFDR